MPKMLRQEILEGLLLPALTIPVLHVDIQFYL